MPEPLKQKEVHEKLQELEQWGRDENYSVIQKEFKFATFSDAMVFMNEVAEIAEEENHHPDMCVSYDTVVCMLSTHDVGGLTEKDFEVADKIDKMIHRLVEENREEEE